MEIIPYLYRETHEGMMATALLDKKQQKIMAGIPAMNDFSRIYFYTVQSKSDHELVSVLDRMVGLNDTVLAGWLNITPRTFRNYKNSPHLILKDNTREHLILILSLYKHGIAVFGNAADFEKWLSADNYLLDNQAPVNFLDTISGIRFIDNRLTSLEYGENV